MTDEEALLFMENRAKQQRVMTEDEVLQYMEGIAPTKVEEPEPPGLFQSAIGTTFEAVGKQIGALGGLGNYMADMQPPSTYGSRGPMPSRQPPPIPRMPGSGVLQDVGASLERTGEFIYPREVRGTGGFREDLGALAGQLGPGLGAGLVNPALGAAQFFTQMGAQGYFDTLERTKDPEKAILSYLGNGAIATLTDLGYGKALRGLVRKLAGAGPTVVTRTAVVADAAKNVGKLQAINMLQTGATAGLDEILTDQDREIFREMAETLKDPALLTASTFFSLLGAPARVRRGVEKARTEADFARVETQPGEKRRTVADIGPETAPGAVTQAERDWARRWLSAPEQKQGPIGFPDLEAESLEAAVAAERAGGKHGPIITGREKPIETVRWPMGVKKSLAEPLHVDVNPVRSVADKLFDIARDYNIPFPEREKFLNDLDAIHKRWQTPSPRSKSVDDLIEEVADYYYGKLREWSDAGLLPKRVKEPVVEPPSIVERRARAMRTIETIGKVAGASDEEIEAGREILRIVPEELLEEEFAQQAKRLRERAVKQAPKEEPDILEPARELVRQSERAEPGETADLDYEQALDVAQRTLAKRREQGVKPTILDVALEDLVKASTEPPTGDPKKEAAQTKRTLEAIEGVKRQIERADVAKKEAPPKPTGDVEMAPALEEAQGKIPELPKGTKGPGMEEAPPRGGGGAVEPRVKTVPAARDPAEIEKELKEAELVQNAWEKEAADAAKRGGGFTPGAIKDFRAARDRVNRLREELARATEKQAAADARRERLGREADESLKRRLAAGAPTRADPAAKDLATAIGKLAAKKTRNPGAWTAEDQAQLDDLIRRRDRPEALKAKETIERLRAKTANRQVWTDKESEDFDQARETLRDWNSDHPNDPIHLAMEVPTPPREQPKPDPKGTPDEGTISFYSGLPPLYGKAIDVSAEGAKKGLKAAKDWVVKYIIKWHGGKPEAGALLEERARGAVDVEVGKGRRATRRLQDAIKAHNKTAGIGDKVENHMIASALGDQTGFRMSQLPEGEIRDAAQALRTHIDELSQIMIDEGMTPLTSQEIFKQRMGEYMREAYTAHVDPNWAKKVPEEIRNRLHSLLVSWSQKPDANIIRELKARFQTKQYKEAIAERRKLRRSIDQAEKAARKYPKGSDMRNQILKARKEAMKARRELRQKLKPQTMDARRAYYEYKARKELQGMTPEEISDKMKGMLADARLIAKGKKGARSNLKRKDLSLFKARKGMPEEMKAFFGVEKDPFVNYANTIMKQAQHIANHRKFVAMREEGLDKWLFEKEYTDPDTGVEYTTKVSSADNKLLSPLVQGKDLYTTAEIKEWLFDTDSILSHPVWKAATMVNAVLKGMKTVYQPTGFLRQGWQQLTPLIRHGAFIHATENAPRIWRIMASQNPIFSKGFKSTAADTEMWEELTKHQVIDTNVNTAELKDLVEARRGKRLNKPWKQIVQNYKLAVAAFSMGDNFTKIAVYEVEKKWALKAGMSELEAQKYAANIVRNVVPTYSRIARGPEIYRRQPILGTFMAFKAEQIRTSIETVLQLQRELKSDNPVLRERGKQRAATIAAGILSPIIAAKTWNMLNGVSQEEDDRMRRRVSKWDRERNLVWLPDDRYMDMSDLDDASWMTDWVARAIAGQDVKKIIDEAVRENAAPFYEPSLASKTIVYFWQGLDQYGRKITDPGKWIIEQFVPSVARDIATGKADIGELTGLGIRKIRR